MKKTCTGSEVAWRFSRHPHRSPSVRLTSLLRQLIGLEATIVVATEFDSAGLVVDVRPSHRVPRYSGCGRKVWGSYDRRRRALATPRRGRHDAAPALRPPPGRLPLLRRRTGRDGSMGRRRLVVHAPVRGPGRLPGTALRQEDGQRPDAHRRDHGRRHHPEGGRPLRARRRARPPHAHRRRRAVVPPAPRVRHRRRRPRARRGHLGAPRQEHRHPQSVLRRARRGARRQARGGDHRHVRRLHQGRDRGVAGRPGHLRPLPRAAAGPRCARPGPPSRDAHRRHSRRQAQLEGHPAGRCRRTHGTSPASSTTSSPCCSGPTGPSTAPTSSRRRWPPASTAASFTTPTASWASGWPGPYEAGWLPSSAWPARSRSTSKASSPTSTRASRTPGSKVSTGGFEPSRAAPSASTAPRASSPSSDFCCAGIHLAPVFVYPGDLSFRRRSETGATPPR